MESRHTTEVKAGSLFRSKPAQVKKAAVQNPNAGNHRIKKARIKVVTQVGGGLGDFHGRGRRSVPSCLRPGEAFRV